MKPDVQSVRIIDSHTGGEPTRVVVTGGPELGSGPLAERVQRFRSRHDQFRSAVVNEPRGSDVLVGALLTPPVDPASAAGVIFFNNVGYIGMCGHGTIGLVVTLAHLGMIKPGDHRIETPVGTVTARLHPDGSVSVRNVPSYRLSKSVKVNIPNHGALHGDVAWGGNWFFLVEDHGQTLTLDNVNHLLEFTWQIRQALALAGITGQDGHEIDHIELFGPPSRPDCHSRNFVLCPGRAYDRSPCGTGTSAKLACLFADGKLKSGERWHQESIIGSVFEGSVEQVGVELIPTIQGTAYVTAEASLLLDPQDPLCWGIQPEGGK